MEKTGLRERMIKKAEYRNGLSTGGYVCTDGKWCMTRTPEEFKALIEELGFKVKECKGTSFSTAIAVTEDGYLFAWNGYCGKMTDDILRLIRNQDGSV